LFRLAPHVLKAASKYEFLRRDTSVQNGPEALTFVMLLSGIANDDALRLLDELREGVANISFKSRGDSVSITISGGFTALRTNDSAAKAFERADKALYRAKQTGRNRIVAVLVRPVGHARIG